MSFPVVILGAPSTPPAPPVNPWPGMTLTWIGWNGHAFDLAGGRAPSGVVVQAGMRGLNMPAIEHHESETEVRAGTRWRSARTLKREIFLPVRVYENTDSQAWIEYDAAFWRTMHPEKPGLLVATKPDGSTRSLACRFVDDGGHAHDHSPGLLGWMTYGITLQAEQPYWQGSPVTRSWRIGGGGQPFIPAEGAPPFYISAAQTTATASIDNPGDVDAFITWTLRGPVDAGAVFGVGSSLVGFTPAIPDGSTLVVNTREMSARLDGVRASQDLSPRDFAPVPAGEEIDLTITAGGTGEIQAVLVPNYFRAT